MKEKKSIKKKENPVSLSVAIGAILALILLIYFLFSIPGIIDAIKSYRNHNGKLLIQNATENNNVSEIVHGDAQDKYFGLVASDKAFVIKSTQLIIDAVFENNSIGKSYNSSNLPCFDSDSGSDFYHHGITVGFWAADSEPYNYEPSYKEDSCIDSTLYEMICKSVSRKPLIQKMVGLTFNCPNGCSDGSCICSTDSDCGTGVCDSGICD